MKVIIAGSRKYARYRYYKIMEEAIKESGFEITEIISGGALGIDTFAEIYADVNGIKKKIFYPKYDKFPGRIAPLKRNEEMAAYGDALIVIWDGKTGGSLNMYNNAKKKGLKIYSKEI